ncbi:MAG: AAA family ATPase [Myxococcota bacterium]
MSDAPNVSALLAPDFLWDYRCNEKGCCCGPWKVGLREEDFHRLRLAATGTPLAGELSKALAVKEATPFANFLPSNSRVRRFDGHFASVRKGADGNCTFLDEDTRCRVHATVGEEALPGICRNFPIAGFEAPDGPMAFWDLLCPEVANLLASASTPASIKPMPEGFQGARVVFRPGVPLQEVALTEQLSVPYQDYAAFRAAALESLAAGHEGPLKPLAHLVAYVHRWGESSVQPALGGPPLTEAMGAVVIEHLVNGALDAEAQREALSAKVSFARRFFTHHTWGEEGVLNVIEAGHLPNAEAALTALDGVAPSVHLALTNYLIMKLWGIPLARRGSVQGDLLELLRRLATALYVAGGLAHHRGGPLSAEQLVAALSFADVVYRVPTTAPKPLAERPRASTLALTGKLSDLARFAPTLGPLRLGVGGFESDAAMLAQLMRVLRVRAQIALEGHAVEVKRGVRAMRASEALSADPLWAETSQVSLKQRLAADSAAFTARLALSTDTVALARVSRRLRLTSEEVQLLGVLLANQSDLAWSRAMAHVTLDYGDRAPTFRSLEVLFGPAVRQLLGAQSRLRRLHLVTARGEGADGDTMEARLELPAEVLAALLGGAATWPNALGAFRCRPARTSAWLSPPAEVQAALTGAAQRGSERGTLIALVGPDGLDRPGLLQRSLARDVFAVRMDAEALKAAKGGGVQALYLAARHAVLAGQECLYMIDAQGLAVSAARDALIELATLIGRPLFVATERSPSALYGRVSVDEVKVTGAALSDRTKALVRSVPSDVLLSEPGALQGLLRSIAVPPARIPGAVDRVVGEALVKASGSGRPGGRARPKLSVERLRGALREQISSNIGDFAHAITPGGSWSDLQLAVESKAQLQEVVTAHQHRDKVLNAWGFAGTGATGNGVTALLYGPPGTGKTMAAGIVAGELGLEVFQVDLSRVVNKYIGETEKALGKVFDEAQRGEVLLLFDEADSLFGARTEVQSSTDRYANLEVNYLLQRIEAYTGIVVLTTNHESLIDPAFKRRLRYQIHFPLPAAEERSGIWRSLMPPEMPLSDDVDIDELAHRFEFSGGHVKNAVLTAAILATIEGTAVGMGHLTEGGNREYRSLGKIVREYDDD